MVYLNGRLKALTRLTRTHARTIMRAMRTIARRAGVYLVCYRSRRARELELQQRSRASGIKPSKFSRTIKDNKVAGDLTHLAWLTHHPNHSRLDATAP